MTENKFKILEQDFDRHAKTYQADLQSALAGIPMEKDFYLQKKIQMFDEIFQTFAEDTNILDFGAGVGSLIIPMAIKWPKLQFFAFDVSEKSLEEISQKQISNIQVIKNISQISQYDFIYSVNVFHHISPNDRQNEFHKLTMCLKPKGKILILEHNPINPLTRWVVSRCEFDRGVKLLSKHELIKLNERSSLKVQNHQFIVFFPFQNTLFDRLEKFLSWCPMGAQQIVLFQSVV